MTERGGSIRRDDIERGGDSAPAESVKENPRLFFQDCLVLVHALTFFFLPFFHGGSV